MGNEVKYFKGKGLEFVWGDQCGDNINIPEFVGVFGIDELQNSEVSEFAWRTNKGKKPSYTGEIEVFEDENTSVYGRASDFIWTQSIQVPPVDKWRPVLQSNKNTVEDSAYTQDMYDNKILPEVGTLFLSDEYLEDYETLKCIGEHKGAVIGLDFEGNLEFYKQEFCYPLGIQDEAIQEKLKSYIEQNFNWCISASTHMTQKLLQEFDIKLKR